MNRYTTPEAFKQALETRLRHQAGRAATDITHFRQLLVFDRFLSRVFAEFGEKVVLKGGVVLELRLQRARATRDIDLRLLGDPEGVLEQLRNAGRRNMGDFFSFNAEPDPEYPVIGGDGI